FICLSLIYYCVLKFEHSYVGSVFVSQHGYVYLCNLFQSMLHFNFISQPLLTYTYTVYKSSIYRSKVKASLHLYFYFIYVLLDLNFLIVLCAQ
ncbi:hypothetical protein M8C21_032430, partial [Ambrosia artemisiifolia]